MNKTILFVLLLLCALPAITCKNRDFSNPVDPSVSITTSTVLRIDSLTEVSAALAWQMERPDPDYPNVPLQIIIWRRTDAAEFSVVDSTGAGTAAKSVAGVYQAGVTYYFKIQLKAAVNTLSYSNVAAKTLVFTAPYGLAINALTETSASLQWADSSSFTLGYLIFRSVDGINFPVVDSVGPGVTAKAVEGMYQAGVTYSFRVRAKFAHNTSPISNTAAKNYLFTAPSNLTVTAVTTASAMLEWTDNSIFETGFLIERSTDGVVYSLVDSADSNVTTKAVAGAYLADATYWFRVQAKSAYQKSTFSNAAQGSIFVRDIVMVPVSGGTFQMGTAVGSSNEQPVHAVSVRSFYIDRYEVTYEKWTAVRNWGLNHGYTDVPAGQNGSSPNGTNNPVTKVNWYDVVKWCNARSEMDGLTPVYRTDTTLAVVYRTGEISPGAEAVRWTANGYRIPTEAEWEFAARGGSKSNNFAYSGSGTIGDVAWYYTNSGNATHQVGTKNANELGIYDMSGNVLEWCWDWYAGYSGGAQADPRGPQSGSYRVLRGGSFNNLVEVGYDCRVVFRDNGGPLIRTYNNAGFRCVQY